MAAKRLSTHTHGNGTGLDIVHTMRALDLEYCFPQPSTSNHHTTRVPLLGTYLTSARVEDLFEMLSHGGMGSSEVRSANQKD